MSDLYVDGVRSKYLREAIEKARSRARSRDDMFWASQPLSIDTDARDVLQVEFAGYRMVNHVAFLAARFPHTVEAEYWDPQVEDWKPLREQKAMIDPVDPAFSVAAQRSRWEGPAVAHTILDSYPAVIGSASGKVVGLNHPHHYGGKHWVPVTWRCVPVYTRAIRLILTRPGYIGRAGLSAFPPVDSQGREMPYSLAIKDLQVGYRVYAERDIPDTYRASLAAFATSTDLMGSRISYRLKEYSPDQVLDDVDGRHWRSEPQPVNYAVVNFHLDVRDKQGKAQVIDRLYVDPLTVGPAMNLYWTNEDPDADFEADDSPLTYPVARVLGTPPEVERDTVDTPTVLDFSGTSAGNIQIDNGHLQWDPSNPWFAGVALRLETEADHHPILAWSGNTLRQVGHTIEFVTASGEIASCYIPQEIGIGDEYNVAVVYRPFDPAHNLMPSEGGYWAPESTITLVVGSAEKGINRRTTAVTENPLGARPETVYIGSYSVGRIWRQPAPPEAGVVHRWTGTPGASTSQRVLDGEVLATNLILNPSFQHGLTGWAGGNSRLEQTFLDGRTVLRGVHPVDPNATTPYVIAPRFNIPGPGPYRFRAKVAGMASTSAKNFRVEVRWYDSANAIIYPYAVVGQTENPADGTEYEIDETIEAPDNATGAAVISYWLDSVSGLVTGDYLQIDEVLLANSSDPGLTYFDGDSPDERSLDLWYDTDNNDTVHSWNPATDAWETGTGNLVIGVDPSDIALRGLFVKADTLPEIGLVDGFVEDPDLMLLKSAAPEQGLTNNAIFRLHPSFFSEGNEAALVGGPGNRYEDVAWTPIPRDYTLRKGFVRFPPVRAKHFKMEFTNLVLMNFENLVPIRRKVKLFPALLAERHSRLVPSGVARETTFRAGLAYQDSQVMDYTKQAPGVQTMMDMVSAGNYSNALARLQEVSQNVERQASGTEAYVAKDPATQKTLSDLGWVWSFAPWHIASSAPRWDRVQPHTYQVVDVLHETRTAFFVGLKQVVPYRVDYLTDDDTDAYYETFDDTRHLGELSSVEQREGGVSATSNTASITSRVLPSTREVRGVQFATIQTDNQALLPDDGFVADDLSLNWSAYGDAKIERIVGQGVLLTRGVLAQGGGGGGMSSGIVYPSAAGRVYGAARVTPQTASGGALRLEIVAINTGTVIAAEERPIRAGEEMVLTVGYEVGSAIQRVSYGDMEIMTYGDVEVGNLNEDESYPPGTYGDLETNPIGGPVYVRLVQKGPSKDRFLVGRLSLFDAPIAWEFSVDGGTTWYDAMSVRNNPRAVLTFPAPGKQLMWRASIYHIDAEVSNLVIRPWYGGLIGGLGRSADDFVGPNRSVIDDYPSTEEDPMWQQSHTPIPSWWFQRDVANPFSGAPNVISQGVSITPAPSEFDAGEPVPESDPEGQVYRQATAPPAGTVHRWTGTPDASPSEKVVDGVVVATNLIPDPRSVNPSQWRALAQTDTPSVLIDGEPAIAFMETETGTAHYADPVVDFTPPAVGTTIHFSVEVKVTVPFSRMRTSIATYNGLTLDNYNINDRAQTPEDGWVRYTRSATVTDLGSGGFVRTLIWPLDTDLDGLPAGEGFYIRRPVVTFGQTDHVPHFSGDTPDERSSDLWINTAEDDRHYYWDNATDSWTPVV